MLALTADLLQAEDVGIQAHQLVAEYWYSLLKARLSVASVVKVHEVEGGDTKLGGHGIILPGALQLIVIIFAVVSGFSLKKKFHQSLLFSALSCILAAAQCFIIFYP
jgi:hypothetical protein